MSASVPAQRRNWVDVSATDPSDPTGHEVPDGNAAIIAANS